MCLPHLAQRPRLSTATAEIRRFSSLATFFVSLIRWMCLPSGAVGKDCHFFPYLPPTGKGTHFLITLVTGDGYGEGEPSGLPCSLDWLCTRIKAQPQKRGNSSSLLPPQKQCLSQLACKTGKRSWCRRQQRRCIQYGVLPTLLPPAKSPPEGRQTPCWSSVIYPSWWYLFFCLPECRAMGRKRATYMSQEKQLWGKRTEQDGACF